MANQRGLRNKDDHYVLEGLKAHINELVSRGGNVVGMYVHLQNLVPEFLGHEGVKTILQENEHRLSTLEPPPRQRNNQAMLQELPHDWKRRGHNFFRPCIHDARKILEDNPRPRYKGKQKPVYWPRDIVFHEPSRGYTVAQSIKIIKSIYAFALTHNLLAPGYDPRFSDEDLSDQDGPQDERGHEDEEGFETTDEEEVEMHQEESESLASEDESLEVEHEDEHEVQHEYEEDMLNRSGSRARGNIITSDTDEGTVPDENQVAGNIITSDTDEGTVPDENQVAGPSKESPRRSKRQKKTRK